MDELQEDIPISMAQIVVQLHFFVSYFDKLTVVAYNSYSFSSSVL